MIKCWAYDTYKERSDKIIQGKTLVKKVKKYYDYLFYIKFDHIFFNTWIFFFVKKIFEKENTFIQINNFDFLYGIFF